MKEIEKLLRKDSTNPVFLKEYGVKFSLIYDFYSGRKYLHKAIEFNNEYVEAIENLVKLYLQHNLPFSAIKVLESSDISKSEKLQEKLYQLKLQFQPKKVTFYIPVFNVEVHLENCIKNILNQTYPIYEILIINDASQVNFMKIVRKYKNLYPDLIKIIEHSENRGLSAVRNTALKNAKGEFLATVDTDAVPEDIFLEKIMMEYHKREKENIGGICGRLVELNSVTVVDRWREIHMKQHWGDKICEPPFLYDSTSVFKLDTLKKSGGFNGEYYDISEKLKANNYKLLYIPEAKAYHLRKDSLKSVIDTFYNWVLPPYINNLDNFGKLLFKCESCFKFLYIRIKKDIKFKRYHIIYPTFLSLFLLPLKDILSSEIKENEKSDTLFGLAGMLFNLINENKYISNNLTGYLFSDIEEILEITNLKKSVEKIEEIEDVLSYFPEANINYILKVVEKVKGFLNFEPLIYKMIEISRERIEYENRFEKEFKDKSFKILITNPPWRDGKRYGIRAGSRWPFTIEVSQENMQIPPSYVPYPFFLGYTTSLLKQEGFYTVMIDAIAEGLLDDEYFSRVKGYSPDIILMETATASIYNDIDYVRKLKTLLPDVKIILTGTHVSHFKEEFLKEYPCVDGIIIGEYEEAFVNIVKYFKKYKKFEGIKQKGFLYYNENGEITGSSEKTDLVDIDKLPYPERLTLPVYNYEDLFAGMVFPSLQIHASRGCPFGCIYCVWPQVLYSSRKYRTRDPVKVVDEIEEMVKFYGYKSFYFDDDTFNIGKERILKICEEIKKRGLDKIPWSIMARADLLDFETLKTMKDAGLTSIKFGVESAVQELVDACGKGLDLKKVEQAVKWCKQLDLQFHLTFTFGLPGETKETIEKTIQYAIELAPDTCQFSLTTPFPGTKLFELAKKKGLLLTEDWDKYDGNRYTVMKGENLTKEDLEEAIKKARSLWRKFKKCH